MELPVAKASYFEGISFRADGWALRENEGLAERVRRIRDKAAAISAMEGARQIENALVECLIGRQANLTAAYWSAMSRCLSPMITGPARFPVERNRKRTAASDKRLGEILDDLPRAFSALERAAFPHGMPGEAIRGDDPEALEKLKAKLASGVKYAERKRIEGRIANLEVRQERGRIERRCEGFKIVEDPDLDRIQLIFEDRPDEAMRAKLKAHGFRWAPSHGAWQRHLNNNGRYAANRFAGVKPAPPKTLAERYGIEITARFRTDDEANAYMAGHPGEGVLEVVDSEICIARCDDLGSKP